MNQTYSVQEKLRQLMILLIPILMTQCSLFGMTFFDTMMSGHASSNDLAGVGIGASIWMPVFTGLNGILFALVPIVAQFLGAKRKADVPFAVIQGVYLALAMSAVVIICGTVVVTPILDGMNINTEVYRVARDFLKGISFGVIPLFLSTIFRCFIDTLGYTRVTMIITMAALPINIILNYLLIFGKFGFPRLGGVGAGYASALTYWCIALISFYVIQRMKPFRDYNVFSRVYPISLPAWKEQLKIGIPIGFAIFCETSIFAVVTLLMSQFNTVTVAAYQIAINFASLLYMIPLSISMSLTIAIGFEVGAKRFKDARQYSYVGIGVALIMAILCAIGLSIFSEQVAGIYTEDLDVLKLTQQFLIYAIFFQLSDAIAAPIQGSLRGYKDVRVTFIMALISYWVVGLPLGYILAGYGQFGAVGYWIGLILGLAFGAISLSVRLIAVQRKNK
ncbi:MATE family efflux transporter [Pelosinus sp. sgz500959]|uniref:MATE family efflux transporter n=1 Tax=Pelosinus sp. sgz500959 TaxID=3242472 RepID=UPI00366F7FB3